MDLLWPWAPPSGQRSRKPLAVEMRPGGQIRPPVPNRLKLHSKAHMCYARARTRASSLDN